MANRKRPQVFISYAHEDTRWKDEFERMLAPACERGLIDVWTDGAIEVGKDWAQKINKALQQARVGLLLVTDNFLKSKFINEVELARLLSAARERGASICWVPVSAALFEYSKLFQIQACWDPQRPLNTLPEPRRKAAIQKICLELVEQFSSSPVVSQSRLDSLRSEVQARLGDKYTITGEVASGKFSIVYRADRKQSKGTVAVKVLVASELDDWARGAFVELVERAFELRSPAFIKILDHSMDESPEFLVSEFVVGERLNSILREHPAGLSLGRVRTILIDLTQAIEEAHARGWRRGEICPSDVLVDESGQVRISPVDFSNILREQAQITGNFLVDRESLSYMSPERFYGHPATLFTDQYSVGLIATELLGGQKIPRVVSPSDLVEKRQLFSDLESGSGKWAERAPELTGIVCRMLRVDPLERWPSLRDVRDLLREIEVIETIEERHRRAALASYLRFQAKIEKLRDFFRRFYANLFAASPEIERHFESIDMERQYKLLNQAIHALLKFSREVPNVHKELEEVVLKHVKLGLNRAHYQLFLDTFLKTIEDLGDSELSHIAAWKSALTPAIEFMCQYQENKFPDASQMQ